MTNETKKCVYCGCEAAAHPATEPVSRERAKVLASKPMTRIATGEGEIPTAAECAYIRALWARLPGDYSYIGTISRIAGGGTLQDPFARRRGRK